MLRWFSGGVCGVVRVCVVVGVGWGLVVVGFGFGVLCLGLVRFGFGLGWVCFVLGWAGLGLEGATIIMSLFSYWGGWSMYSFSKCN